MNLGTPPRLSRVLLRVGDIDQATAFYSAVLGAHRRRVSPGRHHYNCGPTEFACYDRRAEGDLHDRSVTPGQTQIYFTVEDLEASSRQVNSAKGQIVQEIEIKPWGERIFWATDRFGNRLCFVDRNSHVRPTPVVP